MCRLLGYAAPVAATAQDVIGSRNCQEWQRMGRLHADGWGTAWVQQGGIERMRSAEPALRDPVLSAALTEEPTRARIAHLRLATEGLARTLDNAHPFITPRFALAHNGSIRPVERFLQLAAEEELAQHGGNSDTSVLVALITRRLDAGRSLFDAVTETVAFVGREFPNSAVNLLVLSEHELIAVHANEGAPLPDKEFDAANLGDDLPRDHIDHYYRLSYRRDEHGIVAFTSSGLERDGWTPMPQSTAARIDLATQA
ncbi:class II glutamine amidotransferase, partial [uncultured Agrococcus sp.]|uniref:class II glutamine amidotransferase n=1 Tax=uncultured Agrococcus sp. TaxID=382258 RepID=UPI0025E4A53C